MGAPTAPHNYIYIIKDTIAQAIIKQSNRLIYGLRIGTVNGPSPINRDDISNNKSIQISNGNSWRTILGTIDLCNAINSIIQNGNQSNRGVYNLGSFTDTISNIINNVINIANIYFNDTITP